MTALDSDEAREGQQERSPFITVLAWISIGISGFATMISALQNVILWSVFPLDEMKASLEEAPRETVSTTAQWIFGQIEFVVLGFLLLCLTMLAASVGLLQRKNWARLTFIVLFSMLIASYVVGLPLQWIAMADMPQFDHPGMETSRTVLLVMQVFSLLMVLAFCTLFGWLIKRLASPAVRREFGVA